MPEQLGRKHVDAIAPEQSATLLEQTRRTHQETSLRRVHPDEDVDIRSCRRGAARDGPEQLRVGRAVPIDEHLELVKTRNENPA